MQLTVFWKKEEIGHKLYRIIDGVKNYAENRREVG
jgi:hypothetical protein